MKQQISGIVKKILFDIEEYAPTTGAFIIRILRHVRAGYYYIFLMLNRLRYPQVDPYKLIWVSPHDVIYTHNAHPRKERGKIESGDWYLERGLFEDTLIYKGMHQRFVGGKDWEDTDFYQGFADRIQKGEIWWRCRSVDEFRHRLGRLDDLYQNIQEHGFKASTDSQRMDVYEGKKDDTYEPFDEISVSIGRKGELLFVDGAHRLSIAKILNIESIPVLVVKRHTQWMHFRSEVEVFAFHSPGRKLYQQAFHPDLADIPFAHGLERWPAIRDKIQIRQGKVLDIGANFGLFCYKLERTYGLDCTAVEINPQEARLAERMRIAVGARFQVRNESIFDLTEDEIASYDAVLALNIFHHFIKRKVEYDRLVTFLRKLQCKELFLETHHPDEVQMGQSYRNFHADEFAEFVCSHARLAGKEVVLKMGDGRVLYRLYASRGKETENKLS